LDNQISSPVSSTIHPQHSKELAESAIDPLIAELNFVSLQGVAPYEYLFYSDAIKRLNTGRLPSWILKKYSHIEMGGWWSSGIDPLTGEEELWGCFKPNQPRLDPTKANIRSTSIPQSRRYAICFKGFSQHLAESKLSLQRTPTRQRCGRCQGRSAGLLGLGDCQSQVAVMLTEGVKKAAALLSQGFVRLAYQEFGEGTVVKDTLTRRQETRRK
jgi:hypothetical protein